MYMYAWRFIWHVSLSVTGMTRYEYLLESEWFLVGLRIHVEYNVLNSILIRICCVSMSLIFSG